MRVRIRCKKLQKNEYIFFEVGGARTYLVHSKSRAKQIKKDYRKYHSTPF